MGMVLVLIVLLLMPAVSWAEEVVITRQPVFFSAEDSLLTASQRGVFVVSKETPSSTVDLVVYSISPKGRVIHSAKVDANGLKPLYTRLIEAEGRLLLFCHVKADDGAKFLYLFQSGDAGKTFQRTAILNTKRDVLNPFSAAHSGDNIYAVWIDERKPKEFALYMNYSNDGGINFQKEDINLTEGFSTVSLPNILADGNGAFLFFTGTGPDKPVGIYFSRSIDKGKTWSEPVLISPFEASWQPTTLRVARFKDGALTVMWFGKGIYMATSRDGNAWSNYKILDDGGDGYIYNAYLAIDEGSAISVVADYGLLEYAYERRPRPSVYGLRSFDRGVTWSKPEGLRRYPYTSTSAFAPKIALSSDKRLAVVVWQDHRYIRGAIYANVSLDGGKSWGADPVALETEPGRYHSFSPQIVSVGDDFYVIWYRARDDSRQSFDLVLKKLNKNDLLKGISK